MEAIQTKYGFKSGRHPMHCIVEGWTLRNAKTDHELIMNVALHN